MRETSPSKCFPRPAVTAPDAFLNLFMAGDLGTLEHKVIEEQQKHKATMKQWEETIPVQAEEGPHETVWRDQRGRLVVPQNDGLKRKILEQLHNHWGAGHPGRDETIRRV
jgi:hypothetical protein